MGLLKTIFAALGSLFAWLTKTSRTPREKEVQAIRKETKTTDETIDESIDSHSRPPR
jgi:hypothetical protein